MAEITSVLPRPQIRYSNGTPVFPPDSCKSIAVSDSRLYVWGPMGYYWFGHGEQPAHGAEWYCDIQSIPGYQKLADGFSIVMSLGVSYDGARLLLASKQDNHGALIVQNRWSGNHQIQNGKILGEFGGARTGGGVACVLKGGHYFGYSLSDFQLVECDVTTPVNLPPGVRQKSRVISGAPGGTGLVASGERIAYLTRLGDLCLFTPGGAPIVSHEYATCVAIEADHVLLGVRNGMDLIGMGTTPLPGTPHSVALLNGVSYAWVTDGATLVQKLYREGEAVLTMPPEHGSVVDCKGWGSWLYCATTDAVVVVRVS